MNVQMINTHRHQDAERDALVQWAKDFVPVLRENRVEIETQARIPEFMVKELEKAGVYRMMLPREYGGMDASFTTYMDVVSALGAGDAGVAWAVSLVNVCNWIVSSFYPKSVVEEIFSDPNAKVAGMFDPRAVKARAAEGGVHIDKGMWFFNSGCPQATWDLLSVPAFNEDGEQFGKSLALIPMSKVKILDDWDTSGMRGSGSNNTQVEDTFVADRYLLDFVKATRGEMAPTFPEKALGYSAFLPAANVILAFPMMGAARHMLEKFLEVIPTRGIRVTIHAKQSESAVMHSVIGQASAKIDAGHLVIENVCKEIDEWAERREYMPAPGRARLVRDCAFGIRLLWEGVDLLASATSGSFARRSNPMNGIWQDVKVGSMHPAISAFSNLEFYGRFMCDVEPPLMPF